jgi:hypothetical protein
MVMQGSITLTGGLVILYYAKPKEIDRLEKSIPLSVEKSEIPVRQETVDQEKSIGTIDGILSETEEEMT